MYTHSVCESNGNFMYCVSGVFRSARYGRVLRRRCRRSQNVVVGYVRHRPKQTRFGRPAGRISVRGRTVRSRTVRRTVRSRFTVCRCRRPLRSSFTVRCPVRLVLYRLPVRSQNLGFTVHLLPVNDVVPARNATSALQRLHLLHNDVIETTNNLFNHNN